MDLGIAGKRALVTGSSKGLGRAIAAALAAEGVKVAICSRNKDAVAKTAAELKVEGFPCDLSVEGAVEKLIEDVTKRMNRSPQKRLEQIIEYDEEQAAAILRQWLHQDEAA